MRKLLTQTALLIFTLTVSHSELFSQMRLVRKNSNKFNAGQPYTDFYTIYNYPNPYSVYYDSTFFFDDDSTGQFFNTYKGIITRDSLGNELEVVNIEWDGNQWLYRLRATRDYDIFNNIIKFSSYNWVSGNWNETYRYMSVYSTTNLLLENVRMDLVSNVLTNTDKKTYTYDNLNRLKEELDFDWSNNQWINNQKLVHHYKGNTNVLDSSEYFGWNTTQNVFVKSSRILYDYNVAGQLISKITQALTPQLVNTSKIDYLYDANNNVIDEKRYTWINSSSVWELQDNVQSTFDANSRLTQKIEKTFTGTGLENNRRETYQYEPDSSKITFQFALWSNGAWNVTFEEEYLFEAVQQLPSGIGNTSTTINVKAFPNPFSSNTIIEFEANESGPVQAQITELNGRVVYEQNLFAVPGNNTLLWSSTNINGELLPAGMYLLKLKSQKGSSNFKLIKQ